ncbi:MAG: hypothetical protein WCY72_13410, partial [Lysobacteraceae bacterium]
MASIYLIPQAGLPPEVATNITEIGSDAKPFSVFPVDCPPADTTMAPQKPPHCLANPAPSPHLAAMAKLTILEFPDPRLRTVAREIDVVELDDAFRAHIADMFDTM